MAKCPKCGSARAAGKKLCGDCGAQPGAVCGSCGSLNDTKQKFCGECGEKLPKQGAALPAEKPATDCAKHGTNPAGDEPAPKSAKPVKATGKTAVKLPTSAVYAVIALAAVALVCIIVFYPQGGETGQQPDATSAGMCGDGACGIGEDCGTCAGDCACQSGYECTSNKCVKINTCGDGACGIGESCSSCPLDCGVCKSGTGGSCAKGADCSSGYCVNGACRASRPGCGDGFCDSGETRLNCTADCGAPLDNGLNCLQDGDCASGHCVNKVCRATGSYGQNATPSDYSVSWSPLSGEGFFTLFPSAPEDATTSPGYSPGGLYGLTITCVDGACRKYDYWRDYAERNCLENVGGMSPQDIRAAAHDPSLNCERFNASEQNEALDIL